MGKIKKGQTLTEKQCLSLTGFTKDEFEFLCKECEYEWNEYNRHYTLEGKVRQRMPSIRKNSVIPLIEDKMLFVLMYMKTYPIQESHAYTYEMYQSQTNQWIHLLLPVLNKTLKRLQKY